MVRVFDTDGVNMFFRRPDGYVAMDTSKPMPAQIGEFGIDNLSVNYPKTPGESNQGEATSNGIRYWMTTPAYSALVNSIWLGPFTGSALPKINYGLVRIRYVLQGGNTNGFLNAPLALNEWLQWPGGSLLLEHFGQKNKIWMWRHIAIRVGWDGWWLDLFQGNDRYQADKSYSVVSFSTQSTFSIDLRLAWGVFR